MNELHTVFSLLLSLIYPMGESGMTMEQKTAFAEAARIQADYEKNGGGENVTGRTVGDVKVTYGTERGLVIDGRKISPDAAAVLRQAGLLCRWV